MSFEPIWGECPAHPRARAYSYADDSGLYTCQQCGVLWRPGPGVDHKVDPVRRREAVEATRRKYQNG